MPGLSFAYHSVRHRDRGVVLHFWLPALARSSRPLFIPRCCVTVDTHVMDVFCRFCCSMETSSTVIGELLVCIAFLCGQNRRDEPKGEPRQKLMTLWQHVPRTPRRQRLDRCAHVSETVASVGGEGREGRRGEREGKESEWREAASVLRQHVFFLAASSLQGTSVPRPSDVGGATVLCEFSQKTSRRG